MKSLLSFLSIFLIIGISPLLGAESEIEPKRYSVEEVPNVRLTNELSYLSDPESVLDPAYVDSINAVLKQIEDSTGVQCAVVVLPAVEGDDLNSFSNDLFNTWGIGNSEEDNGLLIVLLTADGLREIRFETGYGLEEDLPDAMCKRIQTLTMIPYLRTSDYGAGLLAGVRVVSSILGHDSDIIAAMSEPEYTTEFTTGESIICVIFLIIYNVIGLYISFRPVIRSQKRNKDKTKSALQIYSISKLESDDSRLGCFALFCFFPFLPLIVIVYLANVSTIKNRALTCTACGKKKLTVKYKDLKPATYEREGEEEVTATCPICGHIEKCTVKVPIRKMSFGGGSSSSGSSSSSSYSRSSSSSSGGSWGGGSSGGGGASSRF